MARTKQTKRKKKNQGIGGKGSKKRKTDDQQQDGYSDIVRENPQFEKYYKGLGFIPPEEWDSFMSALRENLPVTFRITGTRSWAHSVLSCLERRYFSEISGLEVDGERIPPPRPLEWYPDNLGWHVSLSRKAIRKSPLLSKFHSFLVKESDQGNISRQEAVSMIPPLLLGVEPHHHVLDMCAAPGSKTSQLIELLHVQDTPLDSIPRGVVIANDADNKRCYMLVHQAKRLNSPCLMVTNHDASIFPILYYHDEKDVRHPLFFDRVLCDVPCSGDGTLRKNPTIWNSWNPGLALSLHRLQLRILTRGLELLKPGGRLVYSTCSLNPIENEAVIGAAIRICKGSVEVVDCSHELPGLKRIPGVSKWKTMSNNGEWFESLEEAPPTMSHMVQLSMFPPTLEESNNFHLERCMRILPHHQDTGGFFVAVIQKTQQLPWQHQVTPKQTISEEASSQIEMSLEDFTKVPPHESGSALEELPKSGSGLEVPPESESDPHESGSGLEVPPESESAPHESGIGLEEVPPETGSWSGLEEPGDKKKENILEEKPLDVLGKPGFIKKKKSGYKEDPFVFLDEGDPAIQEICKYYNVPDSFPKTQFLTRTHTGKKKTIYLASFLVKELTKRNEKDCKIINTGVRVFARCDHNKTSCNFRITQEGINTILPYIADCIIEFPLNDFITTLKVPNPLITSLSTELQTRLASFGTTRPALFVYIPRQSEDNTSEIDIRCPLYLSGWIAATSVRLFVNHPERYHYLAILGQEPPEQLSLATHNRKFDDDKEMETEDPTGTTEGKTLEEDQIKNISLGTKDNKILKEESKEGEMEDISGEDVEELVENTDVKITEED